MSAHMVRAALALGVLISAGLMADRARAEGSCGTDAFMACEEGPSGAGKRASPYWDMTGGYAQPETKLSPSSESAAKPWNPNPSALPEPPIIRERIHEHRDFIQPFLTPAVFPEISARLLNQGGFGSR